MPYSGLDLKNNYYYFKPVKCGTGMSVLGCEQRSQVGWHELLLQVRIRTWPIVEMRLPEWWRKRRKRTGYILSVPLRAKGRQWKATLNCLKGKPFQPVAKRHEWYGYWLKKISMDDYINGLERAPKLQRSSCRLCSRIGSLEITAYWIDCSLPERAVLRNDCSVKASWL